MSRAQIQQQLVELDRQIKEESAKNRVPSLNARHRSFPWGNWVGAVFFIALDLFGPQYVSQLKDYGLYALILGGLLAISSVLRTVLFFVKGRAKNDKAYAQAAEKIRELQAKRMELQKQLNES